MKKFLLLGFSFVFVLSVATAQDRTVSGKVTSAEDGSPLPGVNVVIKGTMNGTVTDQDGKYTLSPPAAGGTLVYSFIGLATKEIEIGAQSVIDVALDPDTKQLSEVVVTGYGVQERRKLTSAVSTVQGGAIAQLATPSFADQLSGRAAGVQVSVNSGIVGQTPTIYIRGLNSISSGTFPLVVIDNIPMTTGNQSGAAVNNPLADINPADIESYEILKDGAATAIYGSRAANGVILITTKRGNKGVKGKMKVDMSFTGGYSEPVKKFDMANASEFESIANQKLVNAGSAPAAFSNPAIGTSGQTDWQDVVLRKGKFSNYNIGISGATESTNYYFSVGYQFQESNVKNSDYERFNVRTTIDHKVNKFFKLGGTLAFTRGKNSGLNGGSNALSGNLAGGLRAFPNVTVADPTNPTGYNLSVDQASLGQGANTRAITSSWTNQGFVLANNKFNSTTDRLIANTYGQIDIIEGLAVKSYIGIDYLANKDFQSTDPRHGDGRGVQGDLYNQYRTVSTWNWQNTISYQKEFGGHGIDFVGGVEYQKTITESFYGEGTGWSDIFFMQNSLIGGQYSTQYSGGSYTPTSFQSTFARLNYSYKDKYLIGASVRRDGLSQLSSAQRYGTFPGVSVGYRVSQEDFFKSSGVASVINELKIRGSYATVGNTSIGSFPYANLYGSAKYGTQNGTAFTQAGNGDLQWETSKKLDIGADFGFLNNKITFTYDYFSNDIDGLILRVNYPVSLGIPGNAISQNIGKIRSSGMEFTVGATPINKNGIVWNLSANFTTVQNEVLQTFTNPNGTPADVNVGSYLIGARVGQPINVIYGYEYAGVNSANGFPMYVKGNGQVIQRNGANGNYSVYDPANPTNTSTAATLLATDVSAGGDRKVLGKTNPTWFGGMTNTVTYKGISLEVLIRYSGGNQVYNQTRQDVLLNQDFTNSGRELLNAWTPENPNTGYPRNFITQNVAVNQSGSAITRFVEDGSFLRIQNIVLGYSLPKSMLDLGEFKLSSVRVFAQVQNAFTFTGYKGVDPELGAGVDNTVTPLNRTFTVGLNVGF